MHILWKYLRPHRKLAALALLLAGLSRRLQAQTVKVFGLEMQKVKRIRPAVVSAGHHPTRCAGRLAS